MRMRTFSPTYFPSYRILCLGMELEQERERSAQVERVDWIEVSPIKSWALWG